MASAHHYGAASRERGASQRDPRIAIVVPVMVPKKVLICRENAAGPGSVPFGGSN